MPPTKSIKSLSELQKHAAALVPAEPYKVIARVEKTITESVDENSRTVSTQYSIWLHWYLPEDRGGDLVIYEIEKTMDRVLQKAHKALGDELTKRGRQRLEQKRQTLPAPRKCLPAAPKLLEYHP